MIVSAWSLGISIENPYFLAYRVRILPKKQEWRRMGTSIPSVAHVENSGFLNEITLIFQIPLFHNM